MYIYVYIYISILPYCLAPSLGHKPNIGGLARALRKHLGLSGGFELRCGDALHQLPWPRKGGFPWFVFAVLGYSLGVFTSL